MVDPGKAGPNEVPRASPPHRAELAIVYDGRTGGHTATAAPLWMDRWIDSDESARGDGRELAALWQGGRWIVGLTGGFTELRRAVAGPIEWGPPSLQQAWEADGNLLVSTGTTSVALPEEGGLTPRPTPREVYVQHAVVGGTALLWVDEDGPPDVPPASLDPTAWELRPRARVGDGGVVLARGRGAGARRVELVSAWSALPNLYVSGGDALESRSPSTEVPLRVLRRITWDALQASGLDALAPAENELRVGVEELRAEAAEAGVPLLSANLCSPTGVALFEPVRVVRVGDRRVVLIGWTDPGIASLLPPKVRDSIRIRGPEALTEVLAALPASFEKWPDLVVVFGRGARALEIPLPGVDLVLGDFLAPGNLPRWESVDESALRARALEDPMVRGPALVPRLGPSMVGRVDVGWANDGALVDLHHLRVPLLDRLPRSEAWSRTIQSAVQAGAAAGERVIVEPHWTEGRPAAIHEPERRLAVVFGHAMLHGTGADLALVPALDRTRGAGGPIRERDLMLGPPVDDVLVAAEVPARLLRSWMGRPEVVESRDAVFVREPRNGPAAPHPAPVLWVVGAERRGPQLWVRGRPVRDDDRVRVLTTRRIADDPRFSGALAGERTARLFRQGPGGEIRPHPGGHEVPLERWVRSRITRRRIDLDSPWSQRPDTRFTLRAEGLSLQVTASAAGGSRAAYQGHSESRIAQVDTFSLLGRGRLVGAREDAVGAFLLSLQAAFGRTRVGAGTPAVETEDDLVASVEARLRLPGPPRAAGPEVFLAAPTFYDSEWTRGDGTESSTAPRQRILRGAPSLVLGRAGVGRELRIGGLFELDLGGATPSFAPGLQASGSLDPRWGPVRLGLSTDLRLYPGARSTTNLGLWWTSRAEFGVEPARRILPGLVIGAFADAFVFSGVPGDGRLPGIHLLVGASLGWSGELRVGS